jgi:hypothetical protein
VTDTFLVTPELTGGNEMALPNPTFYTPDKVGILTDHELNILQETVPSAAVQIDNLMSKITTSQVTADVNTMLHFHHTLAQRNQGSIWYTILIAIFGTLTVSLLLIFLLRSYFCRVITFCKAKEAPPSQTEEELPDPKHRGSTSIPRELSHEEPARRTTTFTTYRTAE